MSLGRRLSAWALTCEGMLESQTDRIKVRADVLSVVGRRSRRSHTTAVYEERTQRQAAFPHCLPALRRLSYPDQSRRSGAKPGGEEAISSMARPRPTQRGQLSFDSASPGHGASTLPFPHHGIWGRPRRIPPVSKPLVIGVGRVCHELFLVVTAPSHGCKYVLYCTTPNRANALHEPTRDDSDENRLTRRIASRGSRDYKPIVERAIFVERTMLFREMSDIELAGDCLRDATNTPTGSYIGAKGSNTL